MDDKPWKIAMDDKPWKIVKSDMTFEKPEVFNAVVFSMTDFNRGCFYKIRSDGFINIDHAELFYVNPKLLVFIHETNTERRKIKLTPKDVCINNITFEREW